jgi:hypothetical protein
LIDFEPESMVGSVAVRFAPDTDTSGKLTVRAAAGGFAGEGSAWFNTVEVLTFADSLKAYPLPEGPLILSGGFLSDDGKALARELVGLEVYRVGRLGQIAVRAHLSGEPWPDIRPESVPDVHLEVLSTYQRLGQFALDIASMLRGQTSEALLSEERLAGS